MKHRSSLLMVALLAVLIMSAALLVSRPGLDAPVQAQAAGATPVVISTPTPTRHPALVPTPTPTPPARMVARPVDGPTGARLYQVKPGDTLLRIALEVGIDLQDAFCMVAPDYRAEQALVIGDELSVPPLGVACHTVEPGEDLVTIAADYGVSSAAIAAVLWNQLPQDVDPAAIAPTPGDNLRIPLPALAAGVTEGLGALGEDGVAADGFIPLMLSQPVGTDPAQMAAVGRAFAAGPALPVGGPGLQQQAPVPADWPYGSGYFTWPLFGWLTQGFTPQHRAIDLAAPVGTLVTAADRGEVIRAGWNSQGYGYFVIIDHNIDYMTLYAHLSDVLVFPGQVVAQGQVLGRVGSSGNSTGPHLHFEIRDFGRRIDPLSLLLHE